MDTERGGPTFKWDYFIDTTTKAASPQFDDLSRGLAKIIVRKTAWKRVAE